MSRKDDLEQAMAESYDLISQYQAILRESSDPKERARARREIAEQRRLIVEYQGELDALTPSAKPEGIVRQEALQPQAGGVAGDHIFISYSHRDGDYAHKLEGELKRRGFEVWIDDRIDYGTRWPQVLEERIDACAAFIVILTPRSKGSDWVQNELARAKAKGKPVFPLLLEGDCWLAVQATQYVDVRDGKLPPKRFYDRLAKVAPQVSVTAETPQVDDRDERRADKIIRQTNEFDHRLARSMPGRFDYAQAKDEDEVDRVLLSLAQDCQTYNLWWTQVIGHNPVYRILKTSDGLWLINKWECKIVDLWAYRHPTPDRQYVVIHLAPRPPFDIPDYFAVSAVGTAALFRGRYIRMDEYEDGYTLLDGEIVKVVDAEIRQRNYKDDFLFLAPGMSVHFYWRNQKPMYDVYCSLVDAGKICSSLLAPLERLWRAPEMLIYG